MNLTLAILLLAIIASGCLILRGIELIYGSGYPSNHGTTKERFNLRTHRRAYPSRLVQPDRTSHPHRLHLRAHPMRGDGVITGNSGENNGNP